MKHVNTMQMEELSDDQIAAARARRSKERFAWCAWNVQRDRLLRCDSSN